MVSVNITDCLYRHAYIIRIIDLLREYSTRNFIKDDIIFLPPCGLSIITLTFVVLPSHRSLIKVA